MMILICISLGLFCLGFAQLLESIGLLPNVGNFQPLFF